MTKFGTLAVTLAVGLATLAGAQGVLSPPQLQALKDIQIQQQTTTELNRLMRQRQGDLLGVPGGRGPGRGGG